MGKNRLQIAMQHHRGSAAQIVKDSGSVGKKQRQIVFNAGSGHTQTDVLVDAAAGRVAFQQLTPAVPKTCPRLLVHRKLAPRQQAHFGHRVQAALAVGIEGSDAVNLVVKQIDPVRHRAAHRKQVNQAAAHCVFAGADHLRHMAVAGQRELRLEFGLIELLSGLEVKGGAGQKARRCQPVQRSGGGHQHHIGPGVPVMLANAPQGGQALAD